MKVKIYTTPTCPWCTKAKEWFKEHNVKFTEVDVTKDEAAREYIQNKSGQSGVPQTEINGKVIVGFDPEAFEEALK